MSQPQFDVLQPGQSIPSFRPPPVNRATLALYAGASSDHNPMHIDIDVAKGAGMPDVFAHGMLVMAWAGKALTDWAGKDRLRDFSVRFQSITPIGAQLSCEGTVINKVEEAGRRLVHLSLRVVDDRGDVKVSGRATVDLT